MKQTTRITIEHIVVASDRSYEQVIEALEAQLGLRADWDVFVNDIWVLPHIWGTDELMPKLPDGVFASEAISS